MKTRTVAALGTTINFYEGEPGDELPWHQHDEDHLTFVTQGKVLVENDEMRLEITHEAAPILFRAGRRHRLLVTEVGTRFINLFVKAS
jgi:quercetin dioxygenase-like cupin family protein